MRQGDVNGQRRTLSGQTRLGPVHAHAPVGFDGACLRIVTLPTTRLWANGGDCVHATPRTIQSAWSAPYHSTGARQHQAAPPHNLAVCACVAVLCAWEGGSSRKAFKIFRPRTVSQPEPMMVESIAPRAGGRIMLPWPATRATRAEVSVSISMVGKLRALRCGGARFRHRPSAAKLRRRVVMLLYQGMRNAGTLLWCLHNCYC